MTEATPASPDTSSSRDLAGLSVTGLIDCVASLFSLDEDGARRRLAALCPRLRIAPQSCNESDLERLVSVLRTEALVCGVPPELVRAQTVPLLERLERGRRGVFHARSRVA